MPEYVVEFGGTGTFPTPDGRLDAAAFHRNHAAIWSAVRDFLASRSGDVLEIASGTGQHVVEFARQSPSITWWPSDINANHLRSIQAWRDHAGLANVRPPIRLDAGAAVWPLGENGVPETLVAIVCANVLHISPWTTAEGLMAGAGRYLQGDGRLFVYGPFRRDGSHNAPSNAEFDDQLRAENPEWGVRDTADLRPLAAAHGLHLAGIAEMPRDNTVLEFVRLT